MLQAVLWRRQPTDLNSLSVLYCFRALAALDEQSSRTRAALITCSCSSALQAVCCSARSAHRSGALAGLQLVQAIG